MESDRRECKVLFNKSITIFKPFSFFGLCVNVDHYPHSEDSPATRVLWHTKLEGEMQNLSCTDVVGIGLSWAGAATVTYFAKDGVVAVIAIAASYYLAKWIILKKS